MGLADNAAADEADSAWLSTFMGKSIPEGSTIEGFVSVISYMGPSGDLCWRIYSTIPNAIRNIGLLTAASIQYGVECAPVDPDEDGV